MYTRRTDDPEDSLERGKARVREARTAGRHFPLFFDELLWPLREIELRLRKRSGSLSLHDLGEERKFIEALPHRRLYLRLTRTRAAPTLHQYRQLEETVCSLLVVRRCLSFGSDQREYPNNGSSKEIVGKLRGRFTEDTESGV
jgi:hypothetical protein